MCGFDDLPGYQREVAHKPYQYIGAAFFAQEALQYAAHGQPGSEVLFPGALVVIFHILAGDRLLQQGVDLFKCQLAAMQGHAHAVTAEGCYHAGCIAYHQDMIFYCRFPGKADL